MKRFRDNLANLPQHGRLMLFGWMALVFFGTIDMGGYIATGYWHKMLLLGVIACLAVGLVLSRRYEVRGITLLQLLGIMGAVAFVAVAATASIMYFVVM